MATKELKKKTFYIQLKKIYLFVSMEDSLFNQAAGFKSHTFWNFSHTFYILFCWIIALKGCLIKMLTFQNNFFLIFVGKILRKIFARVIRIEETLYVLCRDIFASWKWKEKNDFQASPKAILLPWKYRNPNSLWASG